MKTYGVLLLILVFLILFAIALVKIQTTDTDTVSEAEAVWEQQELLRGEAFDTRILKDGEVVIASTLDVCGQAFSFISYIPDTKSIIFDIYNPGMDRGWLPRYAYSVETEQCYELTDVVTAYGEGMSFAQMSPDGRFVAIVFESADTELLIVDLASESIKEKVTLDEGVTFNKGTEALCFAVDVSWVTSQTLSYSYFDANQVIENHCIDTRQPLGNETYVVK